MAPGSFLPVRMEGQIFLFRGPELCSILSEDAGKSSFKSIEKHYVFRRFTLVSILDDSLF